MLAEGYSKSLPHEMLSFRFGFTELKSFNLQLVSLKTPKGKGLVKAMSFSLVASSLLS